MTHNIGAIIFQGKNCQIVGSRYYYFTVFFDNAKIAECSADRSRLKPHEVFSVQAYRISFRSSVDDSMNAVERKNVTLCLGPCVCWKFCLKDEN